MAKGRSTFDVQWIDDIMIDQFEILVTDPMFDVAFSTRKKVISNDHLVPLEHQSIDQMGSDESSKTETAVEWPR